MDDSGVLSIINQVTGQGQAATAALPAVLSQAAQSGTSPDQEAEWQRLAKESNVPVGLIRNGAPVKLMQLQQQAADLPATNPVTARTLMDPDNAAVAHDDIGTLTRLEDLAKTGFGNNFISQPSTLIRFNRVAVRDSQGSGRGELPCDRVRDKALPGDPGGGWGSWPPSWPSRWRGLWMQ